RRLPRDGQQGTGRVRAPRLAAARGQERDHLGHRASGPPRPLTAPLCADRSPLPALTSPLFADRRVPRRPGAVWSSPPRRRSCPLRAQRRITAVRTTIPAGGLLRGGLRQRRRSRYFSATAVDCSATVSRNGETSR